MMVNYKQILILALFGMVNLSVLGTVVSEEKTDNIQPDSEIRDLDEMVDTLEALKKEKANLDKLKIEFQGVEKLAEEKRENEKEGNKEKPVDDQNVLKSPEEEKDVEEAITLKDEDKNAQKIENVVKNGEKIVHPFEIAENLYKLSEYKMSLDIYKLIDKDKLEDERKIWVLYQIANCYRKQELYDDAVKVYKELRDGYEGTYWSKQAQWYIQDIEWTARVEEKMVKVIDR